MRALPEIQKALRALEGVESDARLTQQDVAKRIGVAQSAVSNIGKGTRNLRYTEALDIMRMLWPEDPFAEGAAAVDKRVSGEWAAAVEALLLAQGMHPDDLTLVLELLPAIREEMKSAESIGDDPVVAARTASRLLWRPNGRKGRDA